MVKIKKIHRRITVVTVSPAELLALVTRLADQSYRQPPALVSFRSRIHHRGIIPLPLDRILLPSICLPRSFIPQNIPFYYRPQESHSRPLNGLKELSNLRSPRMEPSNCQ